ncbi:hypothetical protein [Neptuniibacter sp. QD37_11]|uniref:hypothetical protein n=1 Tax=Neptuniibacter sp. QD37_11 TaxID=3398209 RepID=UPI0039F51A8A
MSTKAIRLDPSCYSVSDGCSLQKELNGTCPEGEPIRGEWVLRDEEGSYVDHGRFLSDVATRNGITIL